ncbi:hypothetical protein [Methanosarcina mazei]|uniref:Uncharacterized protein n=1 Tax=Methanosarcina mazei TaxID=2209 RepID=A0A0F8SF25_METMZ|nr:hypothetical protein [Methanosarcina mazei]KKF99472.1 hypothetical protein DU47_00470 [Methanosarcina mazei]KKH88775.1 hypothetical protein DU80_12305 [Methanosarcina mazei]
MDVNAELSVPNCASRIAPRPNCALGSQEIEDFLGVALKVQQYAVLFGRCDPSRGLKNCVGISWGMKNRVTGIPDQMCLVTFEKKTAFPR